MGRQRVAVFPRHGPHCWGGGLRHRGRRHRCWRGGRHCPMRDLVPRSLAPVCTLVSGLFRSRTSVRLGSAVRTYQWADSSGPRLHHFQRVSGRASGLKRCSRILVERFPTRLGIGNSSSGRVLGRSPHAAKRLAGVAQDRRRRRPRFARWGSAGPENSRAAGSGGDGRPGCVVVPAGRLGCVGHCGTDGAAGLR